MWSESYNHLSIVSTQHHINYRDVEKVIITRFTHLLSDQSVLHSQKRQQNTCSNRVCVELACHRSVGHHRDEWFLTKYNCTMPYGNQSHPRAPGVAAAVTSYLSTNLLTLANEIAQDECGRPLVL